MGQLIPLTPAELDELSDQFAWALSTRETPVIVPGEAILGIEAIAAGVAARGRTILNIVTGPYGEQFGDWLSRGGSHVVELRTPYDDVVAVAAVAEAIERHHPCAVAFVQAEAVTGGSNPTQALLDLARQNNLITIVDAVSAIGAEPVLMDEWAMDFVAVGAQKALSGSNGISAVGISARGWEFLSRNASAPRHSALSLLDLKRASGEAEPVPANIPVLEARAVIKAFHQIQTEGIASVNHRHQLAAASTLAGIKSLGLKAWQRQESACSPLVTTVRLRQGEPIIRQSRGILAPGDGELYGKLLRVNHFGSQASLKSVEKAIGTLAGLLNAAQPEVAIHAVRKVWLASNDS